MIEQLLQTSTVNKKKWKVNTWKITSSEQYRGGPSKFSSSQIRKCCLLIYQSKNDFCWKLGCSLIQSINSLSSNCLWTSTKRHFRFFLKLLFLYQNIYSIAFFSWRQFVGILKKRPHVKKKKSSCIQTLQTMAKINQLVFNLLPHPLYCPDLAPSEY